MEEKKCFIEARALILTHEAMARPDKGKMAQAWLLCAKKWAEKRGMDELASRLDAMATKCWFAMTAMSIQLEEVAL